MKVAFLVLAHRNDHQINTLTPHSFPDFYVYLAEVVE